MYYLSFTWWLSGPYWLPRLTFCQFLVCRTAQSYLAFCICKTCTLDFHFPCNIRQPVWSVCASVWQSPADVCFPVEGQVIQMEDGSTGFLHTTQPGGWLPCPTVRGIHLYKMTDMFGRYSAPSVICKAIVATSERWPLVRGRSKCTYSRTAKFYGHIREGVLCWEGPLYMYIFRVLETLLWFAEINIFRWM